MPDGSVRWQFWTDHACFDANGNITEYQSVGMDTTEKQEQARKIRESEERYRMITEFSPFPISLNDRAGNFQYLNKRFIQVFGYTLADIPTELDWFSIAFPDRKERMNAIRAWKKGRGHEEQCEGKPLIFPVRCKNGTLRQIHFCPITLFNGEQFVVYEDFTDKTESERLRSVLASIVNTSDDAIDLYQSLKSSSDAR
jgi:PAS domain S-box-containing protein